MPKWPSDKELEEIYRKGSEKHNFEYNPRAWEDMTVLLDKKDKRRAILLILFGVLFFTFIGFYANSEGPISERNMPEVRDLNYDNDLKKEVASVISNQNAEPLAKTNKINDSVENEVQVQIKKEKEENSKLRSAATFSTNSNFFDIKIGEGQADIYQNQKITTANPSQIELARNNVVSSQKIDPSSIASEAIRNSEILIPLILPKMRLSGFPTDLYLELPEMDSVSIITNKTKKNYSQITLTAILGAESSWTPTGEFSSIDYSIGLGINGRLSDKLGFSIGASYIRDLYIANQGDYHAGQDFFKQTEEPHFTSANCKMLEINTGLSYYFSGWQNNGIGIHLGMLSNFMLSEQYSYHFDEEYKNFSSSWTRANSTLLNAINISPVYRFSSNKRGSVEIGPYFKIPLSGIGHGDIMLSSFGLRASVRIY